MTQAGRPDLRRFRHWVFDLDNTLYPAEIDLFAQIDARMTAYVARLLAVDAVEARRVQKLYYADHGTTLAGLMARHDVDPHDFLDYVHAIELDALHPMPALADAIAALPGEKLIFTNGSRVHAGRVLEAMGLSGLFAAIFAIEDSRFTPKPVPAAFEAMIVRHRVNPFEAVMFEDLARNLAPAAALGFTTVLVRSAKDWSHEPEAARPAGLLAPKLPHVHFETDDLTAFLRDVSAG